MRCQHISWCAFLLFMVSLKATVSIQFWTSPIYLSVVETVKPGSVIGEINATDPLRGGNDTTYSLEGTPGSDAFSIDENSGNISVVKPLDRETAPQVNLTVIATCCDDNTTSSVLVIISVTDVDDNDPVFSEMQATVSLPQAFEAGETVRLPTATDADAPPYNRINYTHSIRPPWSQYFQVNPNTAQLRTVKPCDTACAKNFKKGEDYRIDFSLIASPATPLTKVSSIPITLLLEYNDTNTHGPVFQKGTYFQSVAVDTPVDGRVLLSVRAVDPNGGENGQIRYSIAEDTEPRTKSIFRLNEITGNISLRNPLDGGAASYRFIVVARDNGEVPKSAQAEVIFMVTGKTLINGSLIGVVGGCLGAVVAILTAIIIFGCIRLKKLKIQIQKEKVDKENMRRLFNSYQILFQEGNQRNRRSEHFDPIDDGHIPNYNEIADSPSGGGYSQADTSDDDVVSTRDTPVCFQERTADYMELTSTLPRSNGNVAPDGYMKAVSTSASSQAVRNTDDIDLDYIHPNSLKR